MTFKQEKHGKKGESRTYDILLDNFIVHSIVPDIEGRDFMAEIHGNKTSVCAIIQSKFFENNNEVIIRKDYIFDEEGVKTDFFAILHTDDETSNPIRYFFSAREIRDNWRLSKRKKGKKEIDYFVFKINKRDSKKFEIFKGKTNGEINRIIEDGIYRTDEYRNQKYIRTIKDGFKNPTQQIFENNNKELFKRIQSKSIVDKVYESLMYFKEFRRIVSWRLIDKLSFSESSDTSTYYNQFTMLSNHSEIINFFSDLEIKNEIQIKKSDNFIRTKDYKYKISCIIQILNENLIFNFKETKNNTFQNIKVESSKYCECESCIFYSLDFSKLYSILNTNLKVDALWDKMRIASTYSKIGNYENSKELFLEVSLKAKDNKDQVLYFFAKFNQRLASIKNCDIEYPNLSVELDNLLIEDEKKEILKSIADFSLLNGYAKAVDDIYLKIKDFKQRNIINNTSDLIYKLYSRINEYFNFFEGNWLLVNELEESKIIFEKVVESSIVSYSMKTDFSNHFNHFDDFFVKIVLFYCDSKNVLGYFQRNQVKGLPYLSESDYFQNAINNMFSKANTNFLVSEICYVNNRTNNPDLRRRVKQIFDNINILLTYLDHNINLESFLNDVIYFIQEIDFNVHDISFLANLLLSKPELFYEKDVLRLIRMLLTHERLFDGYLLTNCLYTLAKKQVIIENDDELAEELISKAISHPENNLLYALKDVLSKEYWGRLEIKVCSTLNENFNFSLYYYALLSDSIPKPLDQFKKYLDCFKTISNNDNPMSYHLFRSPYTGVSDPFRAKLNELSEVIIILNSNDVFQYSIIRNIMNEYPYYNFIFRIQDFIEEDEFNLNWILENQSEIVLKKISENKIIRKKMMQSLTEKYNEKLSKIFIKYFIEKF